MSSRILHFEPEKFDAQLIFIALQTERLQAQKEIYVIDHVTTLPAFTKAFVEYEYDLILTEYQLPDTSSEGLISTIRSKNPDLPVIFVTLIEDPSLAKKLILAGASDVIYKSHRAHLGGAIEEALQRKPISSHSKKAGKKIVIDDIDEDHLSASKSAIASPFQEDVASDSHTSDELSSSDSSEFERLIRSTKPGALPFEEPRKEANEETQPLEDEQEEGEMTVRSGYASRDEFNHSLKVKNDDTFLTIVLEQLPDAIAVLQDEQIVFFNATFKRLVLKPEDSIRGLNFVEDFVTLHDAKKLREVLRQSTQQKIEFTLRSGKNKIAVAALITPTTYANTPSMLLILEDLTEKKAQEKAALEREDRYRQQFDTFKERQERYRLTFEYNPTPAILEIDAETETFHQLDDGNRSALQFFGFDKSELLPLTVIELIADEHQESFYYARTTAFNGEPVTIESVVKTKGAELKPVTVTMIVEQVENKKVLISYFQPQTISNSYSGAIDLSKETLQLDEADSFDNDIALSSSPSLQEEIRTLKADLQSERLSYEELEKSFAEKEIFIKSIQSELSSTLNSNRNLEENAERFYSILDRISVAVIWVDLSGQISFWNKAAEDFHQVPKSKAIGFSSERIMKYRYASLSKKEAAKKSFDTEGKWKGEVSFISASGEVKHAILQVEKQFNTQGEMQGVVTLLEDSTVKKRQEIDQALLSAKSTALQSNRALTVFGIDFKGEITFLEGSVLNLNFFGEAEIGKSSFEIFRKHPEFIDFLSRGLSGEKISDYLENGDYSISVAPVFNQSGIAIGAVCTVAAYSKISAAF
ncbi:MAG: PAS domain S-box protein [Chloroherpetonaceae bacterium]|nr:PAS domain S-box protein [Chloroherpetonaceae bacterium]